MDDGQVRQTETEVRSRLQRELRAIPVRPYAEYRARALGAMRPRGRAVRLAGALATGAALLVVALVVGSSLADLRRGASASPTPAPTTPAATASADVSPTPTTSPGAGDRYGYVFVFGDSEDRRFAVRRERDGSVVFEIAGDSPAVSPDGQRLAYWRRTPNVGANDLRVLEVADPRTDRSVLTLAGRTLGGGIVWSNDGQGLLVETHQPHTGPGECLPDSALTMVDLSTSPASARFAGSGGCVLLPLAWDRARHAAAGVVTGPGGYATGYVTWDGNAAEPVKKVPIARYTAQGGGGNTAVLAGSVRASADATYVVAVEDSLSIWRVWPLLDVAKATRIERPARTMFPVWRGGAPPGTFELIYAIGPRIELVRYQTDVQAVLYTSTGSVGVLAVRPDGSGVLVQEGPPAGATMPPPPIAYRLLVVDVATKASTGVTSMTGGISVLPRGVLLR